MKADGLARAGSGCNPDESGLTADKPVVPPAAFASDGEHQCDDACLYHECDENCTHWVDVSTVEEGYGTTFVPGSCHHLHAVAVTSVRGDLLGWLCLCCDRPIRLLR